MRVPPSDETQLGRNNFELHTSGTLLYSLYFQLLANKHLTTLRKV